MTLLMKRFTSSVMDDKKKTNDSMPLIETKVWCILHPNTVAIKNIVMDD